VAYVGIAEVYSILGVFGIVAPHDTFPQAQRAVAKALELAPDLGEAYGSLGHIKVQYEHDWLGAEQAFRRAIELNPSYAPARQWFGIFLGTRGRFDEAREQVRNAQELEPSSPTFSAVFGMILNYERRYDEAIAQLTTTLEMDAALPAANTYLVASYVRSGRYDEAM
jgi:Tfp pilus assembly protein PilF